jgi:mono/diheme cytochrome c family protein
MKRSRLLLAAATLAVGGLVLWGTARPTAESLTRPVVAADAGPAARGAAAFQGAAFGGISMDAMASNAVPWRLVAAALVLDERARDPAAPLDTRTLTRVLRRFGFLVGGRVVNGAPGAAALPSGLPLGITAGDVAPVGGASVRVANLGCAACHAGVTYGADGRPRPDRIMLGMPNSSIDLEAYTMAIFRALRRFGSSDKLLPAADALYPEMGWRERASLRFLVLPLARRRLAELAGVDRPLPFPNGTPGSTNGVAALKAALGQPLIGGGRGDAGVVSIPDLGDRVWRTSLLADGAYAVPGKPRQAPTTSATLDDAHLGALATITTFFTVPSMGVHPDKAVASLADATDIMRFLKAYRPQSFPGTVNRARAAAGAPVYGAHCAQCHGSYSSGLEPRLVRFPNWQGDVGTDPLRSAAFNGGLAGAVAATAYRSRIAVQPGRSYVAPPLTGIWASAPYLHNGSVPTLAALLAPAARPARFMVGGHALDYTTVGLLLTPDGAYPPGYRPFSQPAWIETRDAGHGNGGHVFGATLSPQARADLIEYLKLL